MTLRTSPSWPSERPGFDQLDRYASGPQIGHVQMPTAGCRPSGCPASPGESARSAPPASATCRVKSCRSAHGARGKALPKLSSAVSGLPEPSDTIHCTPRLQRSALAMYQLDHELPFDRSTGPWREEGRPRTLAACESRRRCGRDLGVGASWFLAGLVGGALIRVRVCRCDNVGGSVGTRALQDDPTPSCPASTARGKTHRLTSQRVLRKRSLREECPTTKLGCSTREALRPSP